MVTLQSLVSEIANSTMHIDRSRTVSSKSPFVSVPLVNSAQLEMKEAQHCL